MVEFIVGRSHTGKTTLLYEKIKKSIDDGKKAILLVPEQASFATERKVLKTFGPVISNEIQVLSFTRLMVYLNILGDEELKEPSDFSNLLLFYTALQDLKKELKIYNLDKVSVSFCKNLLSLYNEFNLFNITPEMLKDIKDTNSAFNDKIYDVSLIFSYFEALRKKYFPNAKSEDKILLKKLENLKPYVGYNLFVDDFYGFSESKYDILDELLKQCEDAYFSLCLDIDSSEYMTFENNINTYKRLKKLSEKNGYKIKRTKLTDYVGYESKALKNLSDNALSPLAEIFEEPCPEISVVKSENIIQECDFVACEIKRLLREENYRYNDIAVVTADYSKYENELKSSFNKYKIPYFEDSRESILSQPLSVYILKVLEICAYGYKRQNIISLLGTHLTGIAEDDLYEFENYLYMWEIDGADFLKPFVENPYGVTDRDNEDADKILDKLNLIRSKITEPIEKLRAKLKQTNFKDSAKALYEYIDQVKLSENFADLIFDSNYSEIEVNSQNQIWDKTIELIQNLYDLPIENNISATNLLEVVQSGFEMMTFASIPKHIDEITIGKVDRIRPDNIKAIFLIGAVEGEFPSELKKFSVFSNNERILLSDITGKEVFSNDYYTGENYFLSYKVMTSPSNKLYVTYPEFNESEKNEPSILYEFLTENYINCSKVDFNNIPLTKFIESDVSALEILCLLNNSDSELKTEIEKNLSKIKGYENIVEYLKTISPPYDFDLKDKEIVKKLFNKDMNLSASQIENYYSCPYKYLLNYKLKIRNLEKAELNPRYLGSIIHKTFETIFKENSIDKIKDFTIKDIKTLVGPIATKAYEDMFGPLNIKKKRTVALLKNQIRVIEAILLRMVGELKESAFVPSDFEYNLGKNPINLNLENGEQINIVGFIDRIDIYEIDGKKYIKIVDYKTGKKELNWSSVLSGLNIQMLVYLFILLDKHDCDYYGLLPAGVMYYPANMPDINLDFDFEKDDLLKSRLQEEKISGMFLNDLKVIGALGKDLSKYGIKINKKGEISGSLINTEDLVELKMTLLELIKNMIENLQKGKVSPFPMSEGNSFSPCTYCEYFDACIVRDENKKVVKSVKGNTLSEIKENFMQEEKQDE